jgi:hypothetical protein
MSKYPMPSNLSKTDFLQTTHKYRVKSTILAAVYPGVIFGFLRSGTSSHSQRSLRPEGSGRFVRLGRSLNPAGALPPDRARLHQAFKHGEQHIRTIAFVQHGIREPPQGIRDVVWIAAPDHDGEGGLLLCHHLSDLLTVHARHVEVEHHNIDGMLATQSNPGWVVRGDQNPISLVFQEDLLNLKNVSAIVNAQNRSHNAHHPT